MQRLIYGNVLEKNKRKSNRGLEQAEDLIFMRGLAELNKLIANYGAKMDEVSE